MNDTQIKTRHGLILQGALAEALRQANYTFAQDYQYDETCEKPDFLIPDGESPKIMIETHQTDARNSFQMKTLRAFTAVAESKARYGNKLVSVNVLFGDPDNELPASNIRAMCGVFDVNIFPRKEARDTKSIMSLEKTSLRLAADEGKKTEEAIDEVVVGESRGISELTRLMQVYLPGSGANKVLYPLWNLERSRAKNLGKPPISYGATYYKRMMLRALFLNDKDFAEIASKHEPNQCSKSVKNQLVGTGLGELIEEIDGDHIVLDPQFAEFVRNPEAPRLRQLCKEVLENTPEMHWFFEDIRDSKRRLKMASFFLDSQNAGRFPNDLRLCLLGEECGGIPHRRCWLIDLATRALSISQNRLSRLLYTSYRNPGGFGDPISHIAPNTARFQGLIRENKEEYANEILKALAHIAAEDGTNLDSVSEVELASRLLKLRLDGAIKLRKLDPLFLFAFGVAKSVGLSVERYRIPSIISDLARSRATGRFEAFTITGNNSNKTLIANFISVHDNHGDDKSKEWGARRLATLYRLIDGKIQKSAYQDAIFVLDGEWTDKDVARLYRSGWNHVVRLDNLEEKLREIFGLPEFLTSIPEEPAANPEQEIEIPEIELPIAAEDDA